MSRSRRPTFPDKRLVSRGLDLYMDTLFSVVPDPEDLSRKR